MWSQHVVESSDVKSSPYLWSFFKYEFQAEITYIKYIDISISSKVISTTKFNGDQSWVNIIESLRNSEVVAEKHRMVVIHYDY